MIVRISGEDQYRLQDVDGQLNELDNAVVTAVGTGDEQVFRDSYEKLLAFVRKGERLGDDELAASDLILPPPDLSLAEAEQSFTGEGLIPD
jgi:hypothetical protein